MRRKELFRRLARRRRAATRPPLVRDARSGLAAGVAAALFSALLLVVGAFFVASQGHGAPPAASGRATPGVLRAASLESARIRLGEDMADVERLVLDDRPADAHVLLAKIRERTPRALAGELETAVERMNARIAHATPRR